MLCVYLCYVYSYTNFIIITWNMDMVSSDNWGNLEELWWICYYVHDIALSVILICYLLVINCCSLTCNSSLLSSCTCFKSKMLCMYINVLYLWKALLPNMISPSWPLFIVPICMICTTLTPQIKEESQCICDPVCEKGSYSLFDHIYLTALKFTCEFGITLKVSPLVLLT